jgi:hypothetical protein
LLALDWSPDLKSAVTLPDFQVDGNVEEMSERLKSLVRMGVITLEESLSNLALILSRPTDLFVLRLFRTPYT